MPAHIVRCGAVALIAALLTGVGCGGHEDSQSHGRTGNTGNSAPGYEALIANDSADFSLMYKVRATCRIYRAVTGDTAIRPCGILDSILGYGAARIRAMRDSLQGPRGTVAAFKTLIYDTWEIQFDTCRDDIRTVLPHEVVLNARGSCMGTALLFLLLAQRLQVPMYGVVMPGHFFVRYDDDSVTLNIEPNRAGWHYTDSAYRAKYRLDAHPWYTMHNLTAQKAGAIFMFNVANILRQKGKLRAAKRMYRSSMTLFEEYAPLYGNCAITCAAQGDIDEAIQMLEQVTRMRPGAAKGYVNLGALYLRSERFEKAVSTYRRGLRSCSDSTALMHGLSFSLYHAGRLKEAEKMYNRYRTRPDAQPRNVAQLQRLLF